MRRILIRSGVSPLEPLPYEELQNRIGGNVGNLVYAYGVCRTLATDADVELLSTRYRAKFTAAEQERVNTECERFVIPLADALRRDFIPELRQLTRLVKSLRIPCNVVGMGLRAPYEPGELRFPFDSDVRAFVSAVLEKSACVGVRGQITGNYLKRLGFREGEHYEVIGCPSMYSFGQKLSRNSRRGSTVGFGADSKVCFNLSAGADAAQVEFVKEGASRFRDAIFVPQRSQELELLRTGQPYRLHLNNGYPLRLTDEFYREGKTRFFSSAVSWIDFMQTRDLSFGTRMHGNIVAVLAGTPALFLPFDARTRELVEYHRFASLTPEQVRGAVSLLDAIGRVDFDAHRRAHAENLQRYISFLERNGITHNLRDPDAASDLDRRLEQLRFPEPLVPINAAEPGEIARRLTDHYDAQLRQGLWKDAIESLRRLKWRLGNSK